MYKRPPWRIFDCGDKWLYEGITAGEPDKPPYRLAWFDREHAHGELFNDEARAEWWRRGGVTSLTMFPSDQILLARLLADRNMVMQRGVVVEAGLTDQVLDDPKHPYTQLLVSSVLQA